MLKKYAKLLGYIALLATTILCASCSYSIQGFDEPGLRGVVQDEVTRQPLAGVVVYGYFSTVEGSLAGGESVKEILHVFEVESDTNGVFEIPPWHASSTLVRGDPRDRFPVIGLFKGGYQTRTDSLNSIRHWYPNNPKPTETVLVKDRMLDRTATPTLMRPAITELQRYSALIDSGDAYASIGKCGWEQHVRLLLAQHVQWKSWLRRNIPVEHLTSEGYSKGTYAHPYPHFQYSHKSGVDQLIDTYASGKLKGNCSIPSKVFSEKSK